MEQSDNNDVDDIATSATAATTSTTTATNITMTMLLLMMMMMITIIMSSAVLDCSHSTHYAADRLQTKAHIARGQHVNETRITRQSGLVVL